MDIPTPPAWTAETVRSYVRGVVKRVMKVPDIGDDDDLFQQGGDRYVNFASVTWKLPTQSN